MSDVNPATSGQRELENSEVLLSKDDLSVG